VGRSGHEGQQLPGFVTGCLPPGQIGHPHWMPVHLGGLTPEKVADV